MYNFHKHGIKYYVSTYTGLIGVSALILFPIYWLIIASLQGPRIPEIRFTIPLHKISFESYSKVFVDMPFLTWYQNSIIVTILTTFFSILLAVFAGYALSRFRFRGRKLLATSILATQLFPGVLLAIPMYIIFSRVGLLNTYQGLILSYITKALPFSIWMLWGYFDSIPNELEQAAMVDGLGRIQAIFKIILPLAAPGVTAVALFAFVLSWEEYLYALLIMGPDSMLTLTVGAARLVGNQSIMWGELMAYSVMMTLPIAIIFVILQKYLVSGLTAGAVKL
jgi:multiple sugar transport system permease protein